VDSHHPAVRSHPVTGLKAFNVNEGFVTGFAELKKPESGTIPVFIRPLHLTALDSLLDFSIRYIHAADDHLVRWKWAPGSIAFWDNR
jgi:sulfonate dioxygenase